MPVQKLESHRPSQPVVSLFVKKGSKNGMEILILLKELGLQCQLNVVEHAEEITDEAFRFVDIHGQLPMLTDIQEDGDHWFRLQESGAIILYLVERYDREHRVSFPTGSPEGLELSSWLFFLASRLGPNHDEAVHFSLRAPEQIPYGISRFVDQTLQLYMVLEKHLQVSQKPYIVDDKFSVADIVHIPYITGAKHAGIDIKQFPALEAWHNRTLQRPSVAEALEEVGQGAL
ncbi:glutathione S-transferase family protein [Aspergillus alliaceus]|uniref:glutathione S-transferase family protein n=1 Tax=Petromyces alliaceus TaxID=209559 RepID=UPI0012A6D2C9|nr:glutathione S-transferase [Aspergillus alliaceus]KAB8237461.1 glutathione S-transferase [Aspergillus alliaceus]